MPHDPLDMPHDPLDMPHDPLADPVLAALTTAHRDFALMHGAAIRYPAEVAPFAALSGAPTPAALHDLSALLKPNEAVNLFGERSPEISGLQWDGVVPCLQMVFPADVPPQKGQPTPTILPLTCAHAPDMLALIAVAYPGYFRPETCRMGRYWGVRDTDGTLVAMGGERLIVAQPGQPVWREISGLCTHPGRPGKGFGTALLAHILAQHRAEGSRSWLFVTAANTRAVSLYQRTGFRTVRVMDAHRLQRTAS